MATLRAPCASALASAGLLALSGSAFAATYYVSPSGSDSNSGTLAQPFLTIVKGAVAATQPGDTVYVRNGTYEGYILLAYSGTQSAPITIANYPGESPVIQWSDPTQSTSRIEFYAAAGSNTPIGWIVFEGFEITNGSQAIKLNSTHDVIIRKNYIHDNIGQGIQGHGINLLIDQNVISHNGHFASCATNSAVCNQDHGIYGTGTAWTITNNVFHDNMAYGVQVAGYPYDPSTMPSPDYSGASGWLIANNTFAFQQYRSGVVVWQPAATGATIENNIFYENAVQLGGQWAQGITFSGSGTGNTLANNLYYAVDGSPAIGDSASGASYTDLGSNVTADPLFVDAGVDDFHVRAGSPAVGAGLTIASVTDDFDGNARPSGRYDIGAFQLVAGTTSTSSGATTGSSGSASTTATGASTGTSGSASTSTSGATSGLSSTGGSHSSTLGASSTGTSGHGSGATSTATTTGSTGTTSGGGGATTGTPVTSGCGCVSGKDPASILGLALIGLLNRRRRKR